MSFSPSVIDTAWKKAGGVCEKCGKTLVWGNHSEGQRGAWEAHHIKAQKDGGADSALNCRILCLACHKDTPSYGSHD